MMHIRHGRCSANDPFGGNDEVVKCINEKQDWPLFCYLWAVHTWTNYMLIFWNHVLAILIRVIIVTAS